MYLPSSHLTSVRMESLSLPPFHLDISIVCSPTKSLTIRPIYLIYRFDYMYDQVFFPIRSDHFL